jgi:hypothetical protein
LEDAEGGAGNAAASLPRPGEALIGRARAI